jgi:predicted metal-dependent phosphoesterase TrpH
MNPSHSPFNPRSQKAAAALPLAQIASSDAHIASMIGAAVTHFEGGSVRDLRRAIQRRATQPEQVNHELPLRILIRWLGLYLTKKMGGTFIKRQITQPL